MSVRNLVVGNFGRNRGTYFGDNKISIVQRDVVEVNQHIVVSQLRDLGFLVELETSEAIFASNSPLLCGLGSHCG